MFSNLTAEMKQNLETTLPKSAFTDKDDMIPVMADPKVLDFSDFSSLWSCSSLMFVSFYLRFFGSPGSRRPTTIHCLSFIPRFSAHELNAFLCRLHLRSCACVVCGKFFLFRSTAMTPSPGLNEAAVPLRATLLPPTRCSQPGFSHFFFFMVQFLVEPAYSTTRRKQGGADKVS